MTAGRLVIVPINYQIAAGDVPIRVGPGHTTFVQC
jgi:hypothetical protein